MQSIANKEKVIYNVKDIQKIMDVGSNRAYEIMNSKSFPSFKCGRSLMVSREAFESWLSRMQNREIRFNN